MAEYTLQPPPPPNTSGWTGNSQISSQHDWKTGGNGTFQQQSRPSPVDPNPNLYIHNVPKDATEEELRDLFSTFGTVERIRLKVNQKIGPQALYAFITFSSTSEAQKALQRLDGYDMRSRRLRIEFQRSREDDRTHNYDRGSQAQGGNNRYDQRGRSQSSGTRSSGGPDRRKRVEYVKKSDIETSGPPAFKKPRQFNDSLHQTSTQGNSRGTASGSPYVNRDNKQLQPLHTTSNQWGNTTVQYRQSQPQQGVRPEPEVILLYDLICQYKPEVFANRTGPPLITTLPSKMIELPLSHTSIPPPLGQTSIGQSNMGQQNIAQSNIGQSNMGQTPVTQSNIIQSPMVQSNVGLIQSTGRPHNFTYPIQSRAPSSVTTGSIWTGTLVRNGKKKVPVDVHAISGNISQYLTPEINLLNISHRSSWDEVNRKTIVGTSYITLSDNEVLENRAMVIMSIQRKESFTRPFVEHLEYLTVKQRAGVVCLPNGYQLYLIPPKTPLFDRYKSPEVPNTDLVLLGLFTASASVAVASNDQQQDGHLISQLPPPPPSNGTLGRTSLPIPPPSVPQNFSLHGQQPYTYGARVTTTTEQPSSGDNSSLVELLHKLLPEKQKSFVDI